MSHQPKTRDETINVHVVPEPLAAVLEEELRHLEAREKHLEHQAARGDSTVLDSLHDVRMKISSLEEGIRAVEHHRSL